MMSIECSDCEGTGARDYDDGIDGRPGTELCRGCDGTGSRRCDACMGTARHKLVTTYTHCNVTKILTEYFCDDCFSEPKET